jgi:hypothetical protein
MNRDQKDQHSGQDQNQPGQGMTNQPGQKPGQQGQMHQQNRPGQGNQGGQGQGYGQSQGQGPKGTQPNRGGQQGVQQGQMGQKQPGRDNPIDPDEETKDAPGRTEGSGGDPNRTNDRP